MNNHLTAENIKLEIAECGRGPPHVRFDFMGSAIFFGMNCLQEMFGLGPQTVVIGLVEDIYVRTFLLLT